MNNRASHAFPLGAAAACLAILVWATAAHAGNLCEDMYNWTEELDFSHCAQLGDYNASADAHELHYGYENETDEWRLFTLTFTWGGGGKRVMKDVPVSPREKAVRYFLVKDAGEVQPYISIEAKPWPEGRKKGKAKQADEKAEKGRAEAEARRRLEDKLAECRRFEGRWKAPEHEHSPWFEFMCSPGGELSYRGESAPGKSETSSQHVENGVLHQSLRTTAQTDSGVYSLDCEAECTVQGDTMSCSASCSGNGDGRSFTSRTVFLRQ